MYRYQAKRDRYHQEQDESYSSLQSGDASSSIVGAKKPSTFIQYLIQQRDYYTSLVYTWLTSIPPFVLGSIYLVPLTHIYQWIFQFIIWLVDHKGLLAHNVGLLGLPLQAIIVRQVGFLHSIQQVILSFIELLSLGFLLVQWVWLILDIAQLAEQGV